MDNRWWTVILAAGVVLAASCGRAPETPIAPVGLSSVRIGDTARFWTQARDPDNDPVSFRMTLTHRDTSGWFGPVASGAPCTLSNVWTEPGLYYLSAQARDARGRVSGWSRHHELRTGVAPTRPMAASGPRTGQVDRRYGYKTVAYSTDTSFDRIRYVFNWTEGKYDTSAPLASGDTATVFKTFWTVDTYDIRVRALSYPNLTPSDWSDTVRVIIDSFGFPRWSALLGGAVRSSPCLDTARSRLYVGTADGNICCLGTGGARAWTVVARGPVSATPALQADGSIVVGAEDDTLYCIELDGRVRWQRHLGDKVSSSAAVLPDSGLCVGCEDGNIHVRVPGTGEWRSLPTDGDITSSPAVGPDGTIYVGSADDNLYALSPACSLLWQYRTGDAIHSSPAVTREGAVYVGCNDQYLYAFDAGGNLSWRFSTGNRIKGSPAVADDGTVYFGGGGKLFYALDPQGGVKWFREVDGNVNSTPAIGASGRVFFGTEGNKVYALDPDGTFIWDFEADGDVNSSPVIGPDSTLYVGSEDGFLHALRISTGPGEGHWPMFRATLGRTGRNW